LTAGSGVSVITSFDFDPGPDDDLSLAFFFANISTYTALLVYALCTKQGMQILTRSESIEYFI
jgi:hypothetical protein